MSEPRSLQAISLARRSSICANPVPPRSRTIASQTERQYALATKARELGWPEDLIVVIDEDLGLSGSGSVARSGFARLTAEVGLARVGLLLGLEVSRLARNNADWHRLIDLAGLTDTLIGDADGIYHPALFNDRLLLGLKGTMSEAELNVLRARLNGGIRNKAARGELRRDLPVGFVWGDEDGEVLFHPNEAVGPIKPEDGMSDAELAGVPLPLPLRWWYRWAGKRTEIMSGQNILFHPVDERHRYWQLAIEGDHLHFYDENQGVYHWSTLPHGDDPPVFGRYQSTDPWELEDVTLSQHLILACLFEALLCHARYGASISWLEEQKLSEIARTIPPVAIAPWRWMDGTRFFAGRGAFMCAAGGSVWIGAKTEHPLQFLKPHVDDTWDYVAI
jgi:DNA invertase Pin-like site-specific DNA recombinase